MRSIRKVLPSTLILATAACGTPASRPELVFDPSAPPRIEDQSSGTSSLLQAVSVVDSTVVWISGHDATVVRTLDGGRTWTRRPVPAPDSLQFRDIHAFDENIAYILAAGPGDMSRIYRTNDGGATWTLQWTNPEPAGFYDCFDFWSADRGVLYGDAVDGELRVLTTVDGGRSWDRVPSEALPAAQPGEGGFAASGLCVTTRPGGHAWIATGNAPRARVLHTPDYGRSWSAAEVPVVAGEAAGLTAVSMVSDDVGTVFGGNLGVTDRKTDNVAGSSGGGSWRPLARLSFDGAVYGGLHVPAVPDDDYLLAVGPGGLAASNDGGDQWLTVDAQAWWGLGSAGPHATWVAGPEGRIARVRLR
jgi:photosystem II stability/assembly factor-like uncharacterized protein